jgi:hypothetical protein
MSPTLSDATPIAVDPSDGLAIMERRGSTAEPLAVRSRCWPS